jgi:hypothetical protein
LSRCKECTEPTHSEVLGEVEGTKVVEHSGERALQVCIEWMQGDASVNLKDFRIQEKTCARSAPGQHLDKVLKV